MSFIVITPIPSGDEFLLTKIGFSEPNGNVIPDTHELFESAHKVAESVKGGCVIRENDYQPFASSETLSKITLTEELV